MRNVSILVVTGVAAALLAPPAQAQAANFNVTNSGMTAYVINGASNPTLTLTRGQTYTFTVVAPSAVPATGTLPLIALGATIIGAGVLLLRLKRHASA